MITKNSLEQANWINNNTNHWTAIIDNFLIRVLYVPNNQSICFTWYTQIHNNLNNQVRNYWAATKEDLKDLIIEETKKPVKTIYKSHNHKNIIWP